MEIKTVFCKKIYNELQGFRNSVISKDKESIFGESYKIDLFINLYEILLEHANVMTDSRMLMLLEQPDGILEFLYDSWINKKDSFYKELKQHVLEEVA